MAEEKKFNFNAVTPPPKTRKSRGPSLPKEQLEEMYQALQQKDENGEYAWVSNGQEFPTEAKCSTQLLRWRKAFHQYGLVSETSDIRGTHYSLARDPETGQRKFKTVEGKEVEVGPFVFALRLKGENE